MSIRIPRGKSDAVIDRIVEALRAYEADHPVHRSISTARMRSPYGSGSLTPSSPVGVRSSVARKHGNTWMHCPMRFNPTSAP